jgi:iron(III) transport system ATP-binding protein
LHSPQQIWVPRFGTSNRAVDDPGGLKLDIHLTDWSTNPWHPEQTSALRKFYVSFRFPYTRSSMTAVRLQHVCKQFDSTLASVDIDLTIDAGELFFLLGPSGCGKSTLLRLIAGLHEPSSGKIWFNDRDVTALGTDQRNAVMCFQSYALWPHMTVAQNVAFGLQVRKVPAEQSKARVDEVLKLVQMDAYAQRKPNQLSGGQQQRVALARALAVKPDCLLLDEPLSNLDAALRHEMRSEIRRICKTAGFTTIYVTHDQKEALSVADRIAVLKDGKLLQVGTPSELYHSPKDSFVAGFIGQTNLIAGKIIGDEEDRIIVETSVGRITATSVSRAPEGSAVLSIRPEQIRIGSAEPRNGQNHLTGQVVETTFLGESSEHVLQIGTQRIRVICTPPLFSPPPLMNIEFDPRDVIVLPPP